MEYLEDRITPSGIGTDDPLSPPMPPMGPSGEQNPAPSPVQNDPVEQPKGVTENTGNAENGFANVNAEVNTEVLGFGIKAIIRGRL